MEKEFGINVESVRQHWLKFSWKKTWDSQSKAGLKYDTTLMFNDIPGFRNSAALDFKSYFCVNSPLIRTSVFMDSHIKVDNKLDDILDEIFFVKGDADFVWHTHTLKNDYGFFNDLKKTIKRLE